MRWSINMSRDRFDVLERFVPLFKAPEPSFETFLRRRDRKRRNQRIAAGVVGVAVFVAVVVGLWVSTIGSFDRTERPAVPGPSVTAPSVPQVDYVLDLNTGKETPLPDVFTRSRAGQGGNLSSSGYALSPDRSLLAYVRDGDEGTDQIFIAGIDGTEVRQMTHDPMGAFEPAWSPDGTRIAYLAPPGSGDGRSNLLVLDVATGESTQIIHDEFIEGVQFTPNGSSLLYTDATDEPPMLRTVPATGGKSTPLVADLRDAENGSLSPDGSLVTFISGQDVGRGGRRWVAKADGTERRSLPECAVSPAGAWSPDGSRIVCFGHIGAIVVIDIASLQMREVVERTDGGAIWLDDHTLLVDVDVTV
jgi:Tol biopolymer transport system component